MFINPIAPFIARINPLIVFAANLKTPFIAFLNAPLTASLTAPPMLVKISFMLPNKLLKNLPIGLNFSIIAFLASTNFSPNHLGILVKVI